MFLVRIKYAEPSSDTPDVIPIPTAPSAALVIGRREGRCDVVLNSAVVSKRHARIVSEPDGTVGLQDLGSTNGTHLRRAGAASGGGMVRLPPNKKWRLRHTDVVSFGGGDKLERGQPNPLMYRVVDVSGGWVPVLIRWLNARRPTQARRIACGRAGTTAQGGMRQPAKEDDTDEQEQKEAGGAGASGREQDDDDRCSCSN